MPILEEMKNIVNRPGQQTNFNLHAKPFDKFAKHWNFNWKTSFEKNVFQRWRVSKAKNGVLINKVDMLCFSPVRFGV